MAVKHTQGLFLTYYLRAEPAATSAPVHTCRCTSASLENIDYFLASTRDRGEKERSKEGREGGREIERGREGGVIVFCVSTRRKEKEINKNKYFVSAQSSRERNIGAHRGRNKDDGFAGRRRCVFVWFGVCLFFGAAVVFVAVVDASRAKAAANGRVKSHTKKTSKKL